MGQITGFAILNTCCMCVYVICFERADFQRFLTPTCCFQFFGNLARDWERDENRSFQLLRTRGLSSARAPVLNVSARLSSLMFAFQGFLKRTWAGTFLATFVQRLSGCQ